MMGTYEDPIGERSGKNIEKSEITWLVVCEDDNI